jgi:hypothetical protein
MIAVSVWEGLTKAIAETVLAIFWSVVWVGEPELLGRLQDERIATSEREINRNLNVFNFAFMIEMKFYSAQFDLHDTSLLNNGHRGLLLLIICKTLPNRIHRLGSVYLAHLGETIISLPILSIASY